ncbi:MAG: translocase [Planctomycetaceae bacterium]|nr:translocase [Planctomycetaceae bacterium]
MFSLAHCRRVTRQVRSRAKRTSRLSDGEMLSEAHRLQWEARGGTPLKRLLPDVFSLVVEAATRELGMTHYPVQIMGGVALFEGGIAEMQTGEGKTLTATLPVSLRAFAGKGCHIMTTNDYLADRDATQLRPVYERLGLTVGCIQQPMETGARREAYTCDITYGTASEIGFDFLRDRLRIGAGTTNDKRRAMFQQNAGEEAPVQRGQYFALVDEADSILIDEARTPLIIGLQLPNRPAMVSLYRWANHVVPELERNRDFQFDEKRRSAFLTEQGCRRVVLLSKPALLDSIDTERIYQHVEKAITAYYGFTLDRDYIVVDDEVIIVDESTGRQMDGRKWQDGLHQAVEAKEAIPLSPQTGSGARVTIQTLFRRYEHLAGMTGTAAVARREFKRVYKRKVTVVPTHKKCKRTGSPTRIFSTQAAKREAILKEIVRLVAKKRAVLIGTPSVFASEALSARLNDEGLAHSVLNAVQHEQEAKIVEKAGLPGRITIATNMAGRGTDILLHEHVREAGGLHVIATEMHTSKRIDRQLVGRAARQGDPGSFQFFLSLEDELLNVLPPAKLRRIQNSARPGKSGELSSRWLLLFQRTQRRLEKLHIKQRKEMLKQEQEQLKKYNRMGLDPFLELVES